MEEDDDNQAIIERAAVLFNTRRHEPAYRPPAERMARIRDAAAKYPELDEGERATGRPLGSSWRMQWWMGSSILRVTGARFEDLLRLDRAGQRRTVAWEDWRDRCQRKRKTWSRTRRTVLEHSGGECYYCRRRPPRGYLVIDHVIPLIRGGTSHISNLVAACSICNGDKADLLLEEWPFWISYCQSLIDRWRQVAEISDPEGNPVLF